MKKFSIYKFEREGVVSTCEFFISGILDENLPISTPFTFPFLENNVVLAFDKNRWWNSLGGHIEEGETWQDSLAREAEEEAGVEVSNFILAGYIKVTKSGDLAKSKYPQVSQLPITYSYIKAVRSTWQPRETSKRKLFNKNEAAKVLASRDDSSQMLEIFEYILELKSKEDLTIGFDYRENTIIQCVPVTQIFVFCMTDEKKFCVVRDSNEMHYSLPGGGVELGESPEEAARRELMEESQVTCGKLTLLGTNIVTYFDSKSGAAVETIQQLRYLCSAVTVPEFTKNYNGFETEERLFVDLDDLPKYVKWLNEPSPQRMLKQIMNII